jgi:hypothetical protein
MEFQHVFGTLQLLGLLGHDAFGLATVIEFLLQLGVGSRKLRRSFLDLLLDLGVDLGHIHFQAPALGPLLHQFGAGPFQRRGEFSCFLLVLAHPAGGTNP